MTSRSTLFLPLLCLALLPLSSIAASPAAGLRVNAVEDKTNAVVQMKKGAVSEIGGYTTVPNGFMGETNYKGSSLPLWAIVNDPKMTQDRYDELAESQFRIEGKLTCKRVRVGNSPDIPQLKLAVLAEECVVNSLNH